MGAEGRHQVAGSGQQRLQDMVAHGRSLVLPGSAGHFSDGRGSGAAPWAQVRGDPVCGEQLPVVDQVDDGLGGGSAGRRA